MEGKLIERTLLKMSEKDNLNNEQTKGFREAISDLHSLFDGLGFCLSEKKDLLSQWRGYASDAHGVSIGFSKEYLGLLSESTKGGQTAGFNLKKVTYKPDQQELALKPTYQKIKKHIGDGAFKRPVFSSILSIKSDKEKEIENNKIRDESIAARFTLLPLIGILYSLKTIAFEEEIEWRLISLFIKNSDQHIDPCLFQPSLNKMKPYKSFRLIDLKINSIKEIVLGPKNSTPKYVIDSFLKQNNFNNVEVLISKASYV